MKNAFEYEEDLNQLREELIKTKNKLNQAQQELETFRRLVKEEFTVSYTQEDK